MTSPNTNRPSDRPSGGRRFWKIVAISLGVGTLVLGTAVALGTWVFINRGLTPLLEKRLSALLERELKLGDLERLSLNGIRVGPSTLNATATDPTYATVDAVEVRFSALQVLLRRKLDIDLRLIGANGYVEQHPDEGWLGIDIPTFEPVDDPLIKVRMDDIDVVNSQVTLVPLPAEGADPVPLILNGVNGTVAIDPVTVNGQDSQRVEVNAIATPPQGGDLDVIVAVDPRASDGSQQPIEYITKVSVQGEGVAAESAMAFLLPTMGQQNLPVAATAGRVSGQWTVTFLPEHPITVDGQGSLDNGQLQLISLPNTGPWGNTIENIDATARFKGTTITIDRARGRYEDLNATATGNLDWEGDYDLLAQVADVDLEQLLERSGVEVPIALNGVFDSTITMTGPMVQPKLSADVVATGPVMVDRVVLDDLSANVVLESETIENLFDQVIVTQLSATPELGGQLTSRGVLNLANLPDGSPEMDFKAEISNISGDALTALYGVAQIPVTLGVVEAAATITGPPDALAAQINVQAPTLAYGGQLYPTTATAVFADGGLSIPEALVQVGTGTLTGTGRVGTDSWQATIDANNIDVRAFAQNSPAGNLNADVALAGPLQGTTLKTLLAMGNYSLQLAEGTIQGEAELANGSWQTDATLTNIGLSQFASQLGGNTSGTVSLQGDINTRTLADLRGQGTLNFSAGLAGFSPQLAGFDAPLASQFAWTGQDLLIEQANSAQFQARGVVSPQFNGNQFQGIRGFALDLDAQRYPLALLPSPVSVDGFASLSNGRLVGTLSNPKFSGTLLLEDFGVNQVAFDPVLLGPVSYQPQTGLRVDLDGQNGPATSGILADGIAISLQPRDFAFDVSWQGAQATGHTDGDRLRANLQNLPLQALGLPMVDRLGGGFKGTLSSQGDWVVDLTRQTLVGDILIEQPGLGYLNGQQLTGKITYRDRYVFVDQGKLIFNACSGQLATASSPLPSYCNSADVADSVYRFDGNVQLETLAYNANVHVENGDVKDIFTALAIIDLEDLIQTFQAPIWLANQPSAVEIPEALATQATGNADAPLLDQLRRLAEIQKIQDQVALTEDQNPIPPLNQLQGRFDATVSLSGQPQQLPEIMFDVDGQDWTWTRDFVADRVIAQGQLSNGNLTLQPVRLETALPPDADGKPQLAFVNLAGNLSLVEQDSSSLQLVAEQLPVAAVREIFNLPVGLQGRLNIIANLSGGLKNPTARGDIVLADGSINNQPIAKAEGLFLYENARLILQGELLQVNNPQPLTLMGDIPYAFEFMTVKPADDSISLSLEVADEGLALLNALNNQVLWESGQGRVSLEIGGRLSNPTVSGSMTVQDAVLRSPLLPDPLTNFSSSVVFENNQINVKQLQGTYSNGQLQAAGSFPLAYPFIIDGPRLAILGADAFNGSNISQPSEPDPNDNDEDETITTTPETVTEDAKPPSVHSSGALTVTLNNIDLDLRGIYRGGVEGQIVVGGSLLLGPQLGGVVELKNGRLFLPEGNNNNAATPAVPEISPFIPRFENLKITLANNIQIQQSNLLNVVAQGDLNITGPLRPFGAMQPRGTIRLRSGRINLLTTTFRLAGRNNTARFIPERGIADPLLDIQLRTSVAETQQNNAVEATTFASSSEVADNSIDPFQSTTGLETIRIRASYRGSTSNLLDSLFLSDISDAVIEFSSSPPRSRQEIVNLLSGSYVAALQSGQGVLNFFGGALLNSLQDFISRTLNLSEFRLFPVTSSSRFSSDENSGSTLDIATEVGFDITDDITLSLVKILTDNTPTEFNLRYRLTDEFTIRSTTNFDDRNRVLLEFETRF